MESLLASRAIATIYLKLHSNEFSDKFVVKYYYHPNKSADLAAAILRASSGDAADPL